MFSIELALAKKFFYAIIYLYGGDWFRQALTDHNIKHMVNGGDTLIFRQKINAEKNSDNVVAFGDHDTDLRCMDHNSGVRALAAA